MEISELKSLSDARLKAIAASYKPDAAMDRQLADREWLKTASIIQRLTVGHFQIAKAANAELGKRATMSPRSQSIAT